MRKKIHPSWLIAWFCLSSIAGIAASLKLSDGFGYLGWTFCGVSLLIFGLVIRHQWVVGLVIAAGLIVGLSRGGISQINLQAYEPLLNNEVKVHGIVAEDTALSSDGEQRVKLKNIQINSQSMPGEIWISTVSHWEIKRSDQVAAEGRLSPGFGSFAGTIYRADVVSVERIMNADPARDIRDKFASAARRVINEPEASLGLGYLTGQRTALPEDLSEKLRMLGLTHIVVASGYNLTILVRFTRRLLAPVSKYLSVLFGFVLTFSFILVTGLSPSMTRAGLVTSLCLLAWYFGRTIHPFVLLSVASGITALANPAYVWGDLGWHLSFAAFGGVIILAPLVLDYFWGDKRPHGLMQILVETVSAQLATMPIIALAFGQYAPLAVISNLLILPFVPFAMVATFLAGLSSLILGTNSVLLAKPAELILSYMTSAVEFLSTFPVAVAEVAFSVGWLVACYVILLMTVVFLARRTRHDFASDNVIE